MVILRQTLVRNILINGLTAHDSIKISLLQVYILQYNYGIICLSETFLNSSTESIDDRISIDGYNSIRSDRPSHIPLIKGEDICTLDNCLVTEIRSKGENNFLTCIYRSPSQSHDEFENFCVNFNLFLNNINDEVPICSTVIEDFNARCSIW